MSQGYEMQKHRVDLLKGYLDTAHERLDVARAKVAELETRLCGGGGSTKYDRIDVLEARVAELEKLLRVSVETNGKLIARLNDDSKEGGA